ncbi:hypothetical protein K525DRAFT_197248 [Schizophyllum commune Loenen D]|nr:hypothetical protein K525DRAFT_197248 [Schizophyllum commune Loenen D]
MSTAIALPQELKDAILQHLSAFPSTLASCALAHRTLTATAQSLLFRVVHLNSAIGTRAFRDTVTSSLPLASLVTQLVISEIDGVRVIDATLGLINVFDALPNLNSLTICAVRLGLSVRAPPIGITWLLEHCAPKLHRFEIDADIDTLSPQPFPRPAMVFPALHTLVLDHHVWHESLLQDWIMMAPDVRRLVLWVEESGLEAVRALVVTGQGLGEPFLWNRGVMNGIWSLGPDLLEEGGRLERIELGVYEEETARAGDRAEKSGARTEALGTLQCKNGRRVMVFVARIPRSKSVCAISCSLLTFR